MKQFILDILFPKFCICCLREGNYLCEDCFSMIDIAEAGYITVDNLNKLYCSTSYDNFIVKRLISQFKYGFVKELSKPLADLILINLRDIDLTDFILIPVPLYINKLKQRGFNQTEEIAKHISNSLNISVLTNVLFKTKQTTAQVELKKEQREQNLEKAFSIEKPELIKDKSILLIDDVFTTGSTMKECSRILKQANPKEIYGAVIAKGK